jgi:hypothetical protein
MVPNTCVDIVLKRQLQALELPRNVVGLRIRHVQAGSLGLLGQAETPVFLIAMQNAPARLERADTSLIGTWPSDRLSS